MGHIMWYIGQSSSPLILVDSCHIPLPVPDQPDPNESGSSDVSLRKKTTPDGVKVREGFCDIASTG